MNKQEKIQKEITKIINNGKINHVTAGITSKRVLLYIHSQDALLKVACKDCNGTGILEDFVSYTGPPSEPVKCPVCRAKGYIVEPLIKEYYNVEIR